MSNNTESQIRIFFHKKFWFVPFSFHGTKGPPGEPARTGRIIHAHSWCDLRSCRVYFPARNELFVSQTSLFLVEMLRMLHEPEWRQVKQVNVTLHLTLHLWPVTLHLWPMTLHLWPYTCDLCINKRVEMNCIIITMHLILFVINKSLKCFRIWTKLCLFSRVFKFFIFLLWKTKM